MSPASQINQSSPSETDFHGGPEAPTKPGVDWLHSETTSRALLVEVRVTNGELTVWWHNENHPVTTLKGHWRGPIPRSS